ncbi:feruloyl esterase b [Moniliophthora roreri MCA 2997]|uniref:Carboxylic ester hydrolase n=2 Tax=Moniliophthora roreri TaxID=221103 RepID=V2WTI8_MONRO|nr:feruloyl esterase b [Moniliophthora roreri MCA 2997]
MPEYLHAIAVDPLNASTRKGDISAFRERNGKLITYHGQQDGRISPIKSERYYKHVSSTMGLSPLSLDDFYRLFRISGMGHCSGGTGASEIGGQGSAAGNTKLNPESNILTALVRWVEEGVADPSLTMGAYHRVWLLAGVIVDFRSGTPMTELGIAPNRKVGHINYQNSYILGYD